MNHPNHEEWMSFLYGELPPELHAESAQHLETCAACRAQVAAWRSTLADLDAWRVPAGTSRPARWLQPLKWGIAAALLLGAGFGFARLTTPDAATLRAAVESEIRQQTSRDFARLARSLEAGRAEDRQAMLEILQKLESQRASNFAALRKELETVAVLTEDGLQDTRDRLVQLASVSQPSGPFPKPSTLPK